MAGASLQPTGSSRSTAFEEQTGYDATTSTDTTPLGLPVNACRLVRVGRAILATMLSGEFGDQGAPDAAHSLTASNQFVTARMCVSTRAGR